MKIKIVITQELVKEGTRFNWNAYQVRMLKNKRLNYGIFELASLIDCLKAAITPKPQVEVKPETKEDSNGKSEGK